jgi:hypothetical protein
MGEGHNAAPRRALGGEGDGWMSGHAASGAGADKHTGAQGFVFSERDGDRSYKAASGRESRMDAHIGSLSFGEPSYLL